MLMLYLILLGLSFVSAILCTKSDQFDVVDALYSHGLNANKLLGVLASKDRCSCLDACSLLSSHYGSAHVSTPKDTTYTAFRDAYWSSIQTDVSPQCIFYPRDAAGVSVLVLISQLTQCPFAVKSGGHSAFAGAASSPGGITVSLQNLNEISLSKDMKIAYVEPGNNWFQVYSKLAENELTVVGGRVKRIGVGGLTLGGGISFFSGLHGWGCDNVDQFEVIIANGSLVTASSTENTDLYWALRGGGNNFGIVTRFHLRTISIPGNTIWGGTRLYLESEFPAVIQALTNLAENAATEPRGGQWAAFGYSNQTKFCSNTMWFSNPADINDTTLFAEYDMITPVHSDTRVRNLVELVEQVQDDNPYGYREVFYTFTTKASVELANFGLDYFYRMFPIIADVPGVLPVLLFQSVSVPQIMNMAQGGGNALGLDPNDGPLYLIALPTWWRDKADDTRVYSFVSDVLSNISKKAKEMGLDNDYIYMNYASQFQDVIRGYGSTNKARLIEIAMKYDPTGVFQTLQPGHFKLHGPPVKSDYFSGSWS